ncbi:hypothetical protein A8W25_00190 [Streptomyces sp. ERV7]|uniref:DUF6225 family protein n=1 Tax=Streptomyces sp. ERV7 TaxID=1322334 RepID=UPI0007F4B16E|nr:DUF6225 family protein [Streptomyces sp. ERV7]OAR26770.1 hypothetical protein A8W25_00190 [Streptomyces sp. ERV7]
MTDTFEHNPRVWTAARLREALQGLPDDTPIHVGVADGPGDFDGYTEYALVNLEPVEKDTAAAGPAAVPGDVEYTLFADFKAGQYHFDLD